MKYFKLITIVVVSAVTLGLGFAVAQFSSQEASLKAEIDAIYKGDFRAAFVEKKPELFLKYLADEYVSETIEGQKLDAATLGKFFSATFPNLVRTIEHNVSFEDVKVLSPTKLRVVVTLNTLLEFKGGAGNYLTNTIATYRDTWEKRNGKWLEVSADLLRNQTTSFRRP